VPKTGDFDGFVQAIYSGAPWQLEQQQFAAGILLAQVAVEMGARHAFISLIARAHGPLEDDALKAYVPDVSFMEEATRREWTRLSGGHGVTADKEIWKPCHAHVEMRNRITHGPAWGDSNGGEDARASWRAPGRSWRCWTT
jgi:hypothetical protein